MPANLKAEAVRDHHGTEFVKCHLLCVGHKTHAVAQKSWESFLGTHTGLVKCLKFLKQPGTYHRFLECLLQLVDAPGFVVVKIAPLSDEAKAYRARVLRLFAPQAGTSTNHAFIHHLSGSASSIGAAQHVATARVFHAEGGGRKLRARPRKFVFLGFGREESGMSRDFCRDVPEPRRCSKSLCKKLRAHFSFPNIFCQSFCAS